MRISDWSSVVCSSDLATSLLANPAAGGGLFTKPESLKRAAQLAGTQIAVDAPIQLAATGQYDPAMAGISALGGVMSTPHRRDRKSGVEGKRVSVRVDLGGRCIIKKKSKTSRKK